MTPAKWILAHTKRFPRTEGDVVLIGPECFAALDGSVLCWKGTNYVPQGEEDP